MLGLYKKYRYHGFRNSYQILKNKWHFLKEKITLRIKYYDFSKNFALLKKANIKLNLFLDGCSVNNQIDFNGKLKNSVVKNSNSFYLLGKSYVFENNINWHFNSNNIKESYPLDFAKNIDVYNYKEFGDYRITWELNRHHFFVWYAQQYYLTNEEKYLNIFIDELNDWIIQNKPGYGINFVSSMEISIRLINWILALLIFKKSSSTTKLISEKILNSLLAQSLYLNNNLSITKSKFRNNHSIVELSGLILIQSIFGWSKLLSLDILFENLFNELEIQFYNDGVNFEQSPTYSRFTIESLLIILIFTDKNSTHYQKLHELTKKYVSALRNFVTPDNSVPLFSDCDNGRVLFLSGDNRDFNDFKGFFNFCGIFFGDESLFVSHTLQDVNYETKWWCFLADFKIGNQKTNIIKCGINYLTESGYYIYKSEKIFLAFKSGYPGNKNLESEYAPHIHNDLLSFVLFFGGEPILIDSGTYTYDLNDDGYREYFRSIYAHNTIVVNEKKQFDYIGNFGAKNFPVIKLYRINGNSFEGAIILEDGTNVFRKINILNDHICFTDSVNCKGKDNIVRVILNFHPDVQLIESNKDYEIKTSKSLLKLSIDSITNDYRIIKEEGIVSNFYNCKKNNVRLLIHLQNAAEESKIEWSIQPVLH